MGLEVTKPKRNIFSYFNRRLGLAVMLIALSQFNYGFDNQAFATTQAMDPFAKQFGVFNAKTKKYNLQPSWLSLFNSLNYITFGLGVVLGSQISKMYGRRWCMFAMSCWALCCAIITVTSMNRNQILAARILNYTYIGMELSVVPVFQSEIVPGPARGLTVASYQLSIITGGLVINGICRGTSTIADNRAWRIPMGLFFIVPSIIISLIWFIPESPRWLLTKGRTEEARQALYELRKDVYTDDEIEHELAATQLILAKEVESGSFKELWQGYNLKRTLIIMAVNFCQQATGQAFASQYGALFIKSLGTVNPFDMTLINASINSLGLVFTMVVVDKVGRRPLLLAGALIQVIGLMTMGALGTIAHPSSSIKIGVVSCFSIFSFGFNLAWAPLTYVVTTELPSLHLRDQSQRVASLVNILTAFAVGFTVPYLLNAPYANLGSKVGFLYGSIAVLTLVFTWFCVPECKGKTLEEVDYMFKNNVPLRKFQTYRADIAIDNELHVAHDKEDNFKTGNAIMVERIDSNV